MSVSGKGGVLHSLSGASGRREFLSSDALSHELYNSNEVYLIQHTSCRLVPSTTVFEANYQ